jgi:hypothetical protein
MLRLLRLALCCLSLLACAFLTAREARADAITLNSSTVLTNGSSFNAGTTYYAVFQLVGGGTDNNAALLSTFNFGSGGSVVARSATDPSSGAVALSPDSPLGIGQMGATLNLSIVPGDAFSLYAQQFNAGASFSFDFSLTNNFTPGSSFDAFTFQLYSEDLSELLYEQSHDINGAPQPVPEPLTILLLGTGLIGLAANLRRHNKGQAP